jgi:hypothetical protein
MDTTWWVLLGTVLWYWLAGLVITQMRLSEPASKRLDIGKTIGLWMVSPLLFPLGVVSGVVIAFVYVLTCGFFGEDRE